MSVLRGGVDQAQPQHVPALAGVAPQGIAATRTCAVVVAGFDVLAIGAGRAEPPRLDGRHTGVDSPDQDAPPARVELVLGGELAQRGGGGAEIVIDDGVAFFRLRLAFFRLAAPEDDRLERNALLRESVVGQQSFIGQESEGLPLVDRLHQPLKRPPLNGEILDAYLGLIVWRALLKRPDPASQGVGVVAHGLAVLRHLLEAFQDTNAERLLAVRSMKKLVEEFARRFVEAVVCVGARVECAEEPREQIVVVLRDVLEERVGEALDVPPIHIVQHGADRTRNGVLVHAAGHPAIEAERRELPLQHRGRVQEDSGRFHPASQHFHGSGVVVQIVRSPSRDREGQRVPVAPSRAAGALNVAHRRRGDGAHDHGGEIADVDAKLQGRRGGQQVRLPGLDVRSGEALLEMIAVGPGHERGVLGGHDAADLRLPVQAPGPGGTAGIMLDVSVLRREIEAGNTVPEVGFTSGNHERARRIRAPHDRGVGGDMKPRGVERPHLRVPGRKLGHQPLLAEGVHHDEQDVRRVTPCREDVYRRQHLLRPGLVPGPGGDEQRLHAVPFRHRCGKHGKGGARAEVLKNEVAESVRVPAVPEVATEHRARDRSSILHAAENSEQQAARGKFIHPPQITELLADPQQRLPGGVLKRSAIHAHRGGARAFERPPDGGAEREFPERVPAHPPLNEGEQVRSGGKRAVLPQRLEVPKPQAVRCDEFADEAFLVERGGVHIRSTPPLDDPIRQVSERDVLVVRDHLRDGGADAVAPGSGREERAPVCGVLHVVREGDDLVIVVVTRSEQLGERGAEQAGRSRTQDDECLTRPTVRAVPAQLPPHALPAPP